VSFVLEIMTPVFGLLALGYLAALFGWFGEQATDGLARFVFNFAIPVMLFRTMAGAELPTVMPAGLIGAYYIGVAAAFVLGMVVARLVFAQTLSGQGISGFAAGYSNSVLLGIPIVLAAFGDEGAVPLFIIISIHSPLMFSSLTLVLELGRHGGQSWRSLPVNVARSLATNPMFVGLVLGLVFNLFDWGVPGPADQVMELLSAAVAPCSLFALGSSLRRYRVFGNLGHSIVLTALKTIVHPLIVWFLAFPVFGLDPVWGAVAVVLAALPTGINVFLFANRYGVGEGRASSTVLISTAFSILTLSFVLYLFQAG